MAHRKSYRIVTEGNAQLLEDLKVEAKGTIKVETDDLSVLGFDLGGTQGGYRKIVVPHYTRNRSGFTRLGCRVMTVDLKRAVRLNEFPAERKEAKTGRSTAKAHTKGSPFYQQTR